MIEDKGAAHVIADKVNKAIDEQRIPPGKRDQFAKEYHERNITDVTVDLAKETYQLSEELDVDPLTGLFSERRFKRDGVKILKDAITIQDGANVVPDRDKLKKIFIARSDIGFLGYANTLPGGHDVSGNSYKIALTHLESCKTEEMKEFARQAGFEVNGYILTKGDESALIFRGNVEQMESLLNKIQAEVRQMQIGVEGDNPKLPASLNIDYVSAEEYLDQFSQFAKDQGITGDNFYEQYLYFLSSIADFKADYQKINERLVILRDMTHEWQRTPAELGTYGHLRAHILKGAVEVTEDDLYRMSQNDSASEEEFKASAKKWAIDTLRKRLKYSLKTVTTSGMKPVDIYLLRVKYNLLQTL